MLCFSWCHGLKPVGWGPENYLSTGVLEPYKNMQNLAHFEQFIPNHVGDPFGPQDMGAQTQKARSAGV